jgi:glucokinase
MANFPVLVADIGGTNARFAWAESSTLTLTHKVTFKVADFESPLAAAQHYLKLLEAEGKGSYRPPQEAVFAVAAPLDGDRVTFTNSKWSLSCLAMQRDLQLDKFTALNDFEALSYALPYLRDDQLRAWPGSSLIPPNGTLAVIGPGTGLGVAALVRTPQGWQSLPGEGGHASLAPQNDLESAILAQVRQDYGHVSAERLLSGIGLPLLYRTLLQLKGRSTSELTTEWIVSAGLGGDEQARETLDIFCAFLGGFAGNVALTFGAQGGLYVGGGIVPRLGDFFFSSSFRERFEAKGRYREYLKKIPTVLILETDVALIGALRHLNDR